MRALPDISSLGRIRDQKAVRLTITGVAFMRHVAGLLEPLQLTPSRSLALAYIEAHPGADQTSLGKTMGMNRGSTMVLVDNLEKAGLVRREPGPDRRTNALQMTKKGQRTFEAAMRINDEILSSTLDFMTTEDWVVVSRVMDEILARTIEEA